MAEKVLTRARRRVGQPAQNATVAQLRNRENVSQNDQPDSTKPIEQTPNVYKPTDSKSTSSSPRSQKPARRLRNVPARFGRFIASHKKGSIAALAAAVLGAVIIVVSIVISGPMQYLQFASLVKNSIQFMSDSVSSTRVMRDVLDIAQGEAYTPGSSDLRDIGGLSRMVTDYYTKNLTGRGIEFSGGSTITINLSERYRKTKFDANRIMAQISNEFRISHSALRYHDNGTVTISTNLIRDDEYQNFLAAMGKEAGDFATKELSITRRQLDTRRLGLENWLHTISRADQRELRKTMSHLEAWYAARLAKMSGQPLRDASTGKFRDDVAAKLKEILDVKMAKRVTNINVDPSSATSDDWMVLALAMACVDNRVYSSSGSTTQLYARVVMPSIIEALTLRSIEGQIRAIALNMVNVGLQDFAFEDLAGPTQDYFYDNIRLDSGELAAVSGWSSAPVKAALGYEYDEPDMARTVDYALRFLELKSDVTDTNNPATIVGSKIYALCSDWFGSSGLTTAISDWLGADLNDEATRVLNWIKLTFDPEEVYWRSKNQGLGEYSLQTFGMDPSQKLSTAMYGSKYFEDYDNTLIGGKKLTKDQVAAIYSENQAELASDYSQKSIFEKLFDTSDYRSALSKLARDSNWDTTGSSPMSHIANMIKTAAKLPQLAVANIGRLVGTNANAADADELYEYGSQWYGYSIDERQELNRIGNQATIFQNAMQFNDLINTVGRPVNTASIDCFSTQILQGGILGNKVYNVIDGENLLKTDGTFNLNYIAGVGQSHYDCHSFGLSDENMTLLRTYLLDYNLMAAGACYLAVAYPDEKFDHDGNSSTAEISYEKMYNPACMAFI